MSTDDQFNRDDSPVAGQFTTAPQRLPSRLDWVFGAGPLQQPISKDPELARLVRERLGRR